MFAVEVPLPTTTISAGLHRRRVLCIPPVCSSRAVYIRHVSGLNLAIGTLEASVGTQRPACLPWRYRCLPLRSRPDCIAVGFCAFRTCVLDVRRISGTFPVSTWPSVPWRQASEHSVLHVCRGGTVAYHYDLGRIASP